MENYIQLLIVGIIALVVVVGVKVVSKIYNDNDRKLSIGKILSYILLYIAVYCLFAGCLIFIYKLPCYIIASLFSVIPLCLFLVNRKKYSTFFQIFFLLTFLPCLLLFTYFSIVGYGAEGVTMMVFVDILTPYVFMNIFIFHLFKNQTKDKLGAKEFSLTILKSRTVLTFLGLYGISFLLNPSLTIRIFEALFGTI